MANALSLRSYYNPGSGLAWTALAGTDKLWFQDVITPFHYGVTGAILINTYNGGFHIIDASNNELCTTAHPTNLARGSTTGKVLINGAAEVNVNTIANTDCLNVHTTCSPNAAITASSFYVDDGSTPANAPANLTIYGVKYGDAAWALVGGSAAAYSLGTDASGATHDQYLGLTIMPTTNGGKTGRLSVSVSVV